MQLQLQQLPLLLLQPDLSQLPLQHLAACHWRRQAMATRSLPVLRCYQRPHLK